MTFQVYSIKKKQLLLLEEILQTNELRSQIINSLVKDKLSDNSFKITLSTAQVEDMLDQLTWFLTFKGLNNDEEPNEIGLSIEELIDIFSGNGR